MRHFLKMTRCIVAIALSVLISSSCITKAIHDAIHPSGSNAYYEKVQTGGDIESEYMKWGPYDIEKEEADAEGSLGKFITWYPSRMKDGGRYPLIISSNGTGWKASKYQEWFKHMASWGFIVVGCEEPSSWNGESAQRSLEWILEQDLSPSSVFHNHIDKENVASIGHSQGGVGAINAATVMKNKEIYKTIVSLSPTNEKLASDLKWSFDPSLIEVPTLFLSSTGNVDEKFVVSLEGLRSIYDKVPEPVFKLMGRRNDADHGDMLVFADGYVTAWMMWHLRGDKHAAEAFLGEAAEINHNKYYQDIFTTAR